MPVRTAAAAAPLPAVDDGVKAGPADLAGQNGAAVDPGKAKIEQAPAPAPALPASQAADAKGIEEAISRLATALAPGKATAAAAQPAAQAKGVAKGKAAASDEDQAEAEPGPGGVAGAPTDPANPAAAASAAQKAAPARLAQVSGKDAKTPDPDGQAAKGADAPAATPFAAALAGTDPTGPGTAAQTGATAAARGPAHVVENVPLGNVPVEIGMKSLAGVNHFEIRLAPDDLGRVDVKLHIDGEGRVKAHLLVDRPETLAFLQRDAAQLQQTLEQAGLKTQDDGVALSLRNPSTDSGFGQNRGGAGDNSSGEPPRLSPLGQADASDALAGPTRQLLWPRSTGVDLHI